MQVLRPCLPHRPLRKKPLSLEIVLHFSVSLSVSLQAFMEDVKSRGPFIYSVLESAQAFLAQHPFQEPEETLTDGKGLFPPSAVPTAAPAKMSYSYTPSVEFLW